MQRQHIRPLYIDRLADTGTALGLSRVAGPERPDEAWLQRLIHTFPQTLPIREIEPAFSSIQPICLELPTPAGPADNLLVTGHGDLIVAECKLWRNPEARRRVVAQIIDYAQSMADWSYEDLDGAVRKGQLPDGRRRGESLWSIVGDEAAITEPDFVDAVTRNLRLGRMLLLIVGDGIREGAESLTSYLQSHAGFHFTLGIVEMPVYGLPQGGYVVCPRLLARTVNIERGIVRLADDGLRVDVPSSSEETRTTISWDRALEEIGREAPELLEPIRQLQEALEVHDPGLLIQPATKSLQVKWEDSAGRRFNLGGFSLQGEFKTFPVSWMADQIGRVDLAHEYLRQVASILGGEVRQTATPTNWYVVTSGTNLPRGIDILGRQDAWLAAVDDYIKELRRAVEEVDG